MAEITIEINKIVAGDSGPKIVTLYVSIPKRILIKEAEQFVSVFADVIEIAKKWQATLEAQENDK